MSDIKVNIVDGEQLSTSEKEEKVLENAGVDTKSDDGVYRVNLNQTRDAVQEQSTDEVPVQDEPKASQEVGEEVRSSEEPTEQEEQILELIKEETDGVQVQEQGDLQEKQAQSEEKQEVVQPTVDLPEGLDKLVQFMNETGGSLEDYVRLNTDYSNIDEKTLLKEYYKQTKSHLDNEEIDFLIEDNFSYDEDLDDDRDIKRKKLAYKEEIVKAKNFLGDLKSKYYDEVKLTSRLAPDQKEAIDFYNQYKKEQSEQAALQQKASQHFVNETEKVFSQDFKGFDFKVGDNTYRFKVNDVQQTKKAQSDVLNAFKTFLGEDNMLKDAKGYHKALFAARNADSIANHFYEQGKADAIKNLEAQSKNINMDPRKTSDGTVSVGGLKVRAVSGDDGSKLRVKIKR